MKNIEPRTLFLLIDRIMKNRILPLDKSLFSLFGKVDLFRESNFRFFGFSEASVTGPSVSVRLFCECPKIQSFQAGFSDQAGR